MPTTRVLPPRLTSVHQGFARDLAAAWWLAARAPRSLIHLALRDSGHIDRASDNRPLDLVLLHHSLGFRPARWKTLRARTSTGGSPHTVELPGRSSPAAMHDDHAAAHFRERLDRLHWTVATDTLFITGSRDAFALQASQLRSLVEDSPAFLAGRPGTCSALKVRFQDVVRHGFRSVPMPKRILEADSPGLALASRGLSAVAVDAADAYGFRQTRDHQPADPGRHPGLPRPDRTGTGVS